MATFACRLTPPTLADYASLSISTLRQGNEGPFIEKRPPRE
jgi:hypothetical protein